MNRLSLLVILVAVACFAERAHSQGTMMPLPPHVSTYTDTNGYARGFWFTAPQDFTIVGLRVPDDFSQAAQSIQLIRMPPATGAGATTNYTTEFHVGSSATTTVLPVNIAVTQGEVMGILGCRATSSSYGTANYVSSIDGTPVTLYRLYNNIAAITATPATGNMNLLTSSSIARVEIYYQVGTAEIAVDFNSSTPVTNGGFINVGTARTQLGDTFNFTITNGATATTDLQLNGSPPVALTPGANCAAGTIVSAQPAQLSIAPSASIGFNINVVPTAAGPFSLVLSIANNDSTDNPFTFTVQGDGVVPNDKAFAVAPAGSGFAGPTDGPFVAALDPGQALNNAVIELQDPESDTIVVTAIDPPPFAPSGIVPPGLPATATHPVVLQWTGNADATNAPGNYTWTVHFEDTVNGTPAVADVTITINDLNPQHVIADADSGDGSTGNPYRTTFTQGDGVSRVIDLATVSDPNTGQTLSVVAVSPGANPPGGVGFNIDSNLDKVYIVATGVLVAADAGTHTFTVEFSDGTHVESFAVSVLVYSTSGAIMFSTPSPLPDAVINVPYLISIAVSGATGTTVFDIAGGSLPSGISLSSAGALSGTPTIVGTYNFTVRVIDATNDLATQQYQLEVLPPPPPPGSEGSGGGTTGGSSCTGAQTGAASAVALVLAAVALAPHRRRRA